MAVAALMPVLPPAGPLHVLPPNNIDRLRLDFNASHNKVRLLFVLSPT